MPFRWSYFVSAAVLVAFLLVSGGAPRLPVLGGCAAAALFTWWRRSRRNTWES